MSLGSRRTGIVCLGIAVGVLAGCAKERDPINRVQANAMAKSFFVGVDLKSPEDDPEFRMKAFNVGGTVGQSAYTIGEYSALDRVRWEITENLLIARKAYEVAPGADNRGTQKSDWDAKSADPNLVKTPNGAIVAAYRIQSHFDVKRAYNTATGEELNVVEENTSDRAWYDREYIRVDWTQNIVDGPNDPTKFFSARLGGPATPVAYTASSPDGDDAPHVETEAGYFDVTNKFTVEPETVQFSWGAIKKCQLVAFFTGSSSFDCNPQEAVVRLSFDKIKADEDFEPFEDSVAWRDVVGNMGGDGDAAQLSFGSAPRNGYDPQYGYTDALTKRYKNVHELWKASHQAARCESDADTNRDGTADACANDVTGYKGHTGSRCDVTVGKCTIPVRDRERKTVGYWFNREAPEAVLDEVDGSGKVQKRGTLEDLTYSWNQLLEVSVAYRREVECRATGDGDRDTCHAEFFEGSGPDSKVMVSFGNWLVDKVKPQAVDKGKAVLVACHNPVREYDPEEPCGKPGTVARLGDQRKNFLVYWPFDSRAPYGGVAGVTPDPVTGEIRGASATIMGRSATYAAAMQRDVIQLALGDLKIEDLMKGVPADRYVDAVRSGGLAAPGLVHALSTEEMNRRVSALDLGHLRLATGVAPLAEGGLGYAAALAKVAANKVEDPQAVMTLVQKTDALSAKISGFESEMLTPSLVAAALGTDPRTAPSADLKTLASPLHGLDPARIDVMRAFYQQSLADRGACFDDGMAAGAGSVYLASLAGWFKQKYGGLDPVERSKRIYDDLWKEAIKGIGLHELGHSLGLRHNFSSSWDAPNYNPQYWQLRTAEGAATGACDGPRANDTDKCMGPRYVDPMTVDEQGLGNESRPAIDYFANTSTMEYQLERFGETVGLGTYDLHAMKALYGRVLETFDERSVPLAQQKTFGLQSFTQRTDRNFLLTKDKQVAHYTELSRRMKVFDKSRDCRPATAEEKAIGGWRVVHGEVCAPPPKDHWSWGSFASDEIPGTGGLEGAKWHVTDRDGKDRVRWHYRYGEQYGAGGFMHAMMMDSGADSYELVQSLSRKFELTYPWTYFRRQNREFTSFTLPQAMSSQYFARARAYHGQIASSLGVARPTDLGDDDGMKPSVMAQADLLTFLQRAILMPEVGAYAATQKPGSDLVLFDVAPAGQGGAFTVGIGDGRYIGEDFDESKGGSWDYQKYVSRAGFEAEKALAMMQLVDPRPTLFSVSRENFLDGRNPMLSFRSVMPDAIDRLVGGVLAEDWASVAPAVLDPTSPAVVPVDLTATGLDRAPSARVVFPNIGYTQQLQMAIFTALFSRLASDMTVVEKMRLWVDGDRAPTVPGTRRAEFVDPATGFTYGANRFDDAGRDTGIASRMVAHANALLSAAYEVKRDAKGAPIVDGTGKPELALDKAGRPVVASGEAATALGKYIGLMNAVRQIGRALGEGPLGGGGDQGGGDESAR